ncbi:phosphoenolpyruvate carboxylase [Mucilaginibacter daejeonensis]|uniref:phosphoenolpyruvate carboxylase n=1 Tax=Mucilaginibacter daejeonensis TaxID=398049 RepID=UPI001D17ACA1|nr:phosphoenolpyruvate carboxylase [Mucilaginibacter daejeonensis]UEG55235.1 phosphoenolpyruvate carboxylase [Mucilaginibacter daejeonensis]
MSVPHTTSQRETVFNQEVLTRFELYNSLFLTLPFYQVKDTGILLPFFSSHCEKGVAALKSPSEIIDSFFEERVPGVDEREHINRLFRFIQYIERQVVLFDAIEDSSFSKINRGDESGTLHGLMQQIAHSDELRERVSEQLKDFSLRLVLTAHPTQFYPGTVLTIMTDLIEALKTNDINTVNLLLQQLGKTPFFNKTSPTPVDEAISLIWFLEHVFYYALANIQTRLNGEFGSELLPHQIFELGFWPGGDRDGNPNVKTNSTRTVAATLRQIIFRCYYRDYRILKRRITFRGVEEPMEKIGKLLYDNAFNPKPDAGDLQQEMLGLLQNIKDTQIKEHNGIFVELVEDLALKIRLYGCYFAGLDIRQDSRVLRSVFQFGLEKPETYNGLPAEGYADLSEEEKLKLISFNEVDLPCSEEEQEGIDPMITDTLCTIRLMHDIQRNNGEKACHRFIISNCQQASDILQLMNLFLWCGWTKEDLTVDFMPLFETVNDLQHAAGVMEKLYTHPVYQEHLKRRGNKQMIMLGFSDSTKDGGYLMANWSIYQAKVELTAITKTYGIDLAFFDGRGGPPARGGGKTHRFYAAMGKEIANKHIQLTIQGQTVSSQYGSIETAKFNIEQLVNAGITSALQLNHSDELNDKDKELLSLMANESFDKFMALRKHPLFTDYLENMSPLKLLSGINISSRPTKRNAGAPLKLEDLRAISFVTSWSQLKQNVPGFYGVGSALQKAKKDGKWQAAVDLYKDSGFFKTMIDNCMMSMSKSDFRVTAHLRYDKKYGEFWKSLKEEYDLTKALLLELTGTEFLMQEYPIEKRSIAMRERIVLPLVVIQHFALQKLKNVEDEELRNAYSKLVIRTVYGIVNAGRNLA